MLAQSTLLLSLLGLAQAMPQPRTPPETFDYLVVGAGTGGLALASRLSENSSIRVGVLEAGESALGVSRGSHEWSCFVSQAYSSPFFVTIPGSNRRRK